MRIIYGKHSEKGLRHENQDAVSIFENDKLAFFAMADGAGGLSFGRQASQMVIKAVMKEFASSGDLTVEALMKLISEKYRQMNAYMNTYQAKHLIHMATTLSMLHLSGSSYIISNVGDTQVFIIRGNAVRLISQVHNLAWLSYLNGEIAFKDIRGHKGSHVLTRALGGNDSIKPYIAAGSLESGDVFLICTDGVYNYIDVNAIPLGIERLQPGTNENMDAFCRDLVRDALNNGSSDNCSAVLVRIL